MDWKAQLTSSIEAAVESSMYATVGETAEETARRQKRLLRIQRVEDMVRRDPVYAEKLARRHAAFRDSISAAEKLSRATTTSTAAPTSSTTASTSGIVPERCCYDLEPAAAASTPTSSWSDLHAPAASDTSKRATSIQTAVAADSIVGATSICKDSEVALAAPITCSTVCPGGGQSSPSAAYPPAKLVREDDLQQAAFTGAIGVPPSAAAHKADHGLTTPTSTVPDTSVRFHEGDATPMPSTFTAISACADTDDAGDTCAWEVFMKNHGYTKSITPNWAGTSLISVQPALWTLQMSIVATSLCLPGQIILVVLNPWPPPEYMGESSSLRVHNTKMCIDDSVNYWKFSNVTGLGAEEEIYSSISATNLVTISTATGLLESYVVAWSRTNIVHNEHHSISVVDNLLAASSWVWSMRCVKLDIEGPKERTTFLQPKHPWSRLAPTVSTSELISNMRTISESPHITGLSFELNLYGFAAWYTICARFRPEAYFLRADVKHHNNKSMSSWNYPLPCADQGRLQRYSISYAPNSCGMCLPHDGLNQAWVISCPVGHIIQYGSERKRQIQEYNGLTWQCCSYKGILSENAAQYVSASFIWYTAGLLMKPTCAHPNNFGGSKSLIMQFIAQTMELQPTKILWYRVPPAKPPNNYDKCNLLLWEMQSIILASSLSLAVVKFKQPCQMQLLILGAHCNAVSSSETVLLCSCRLLTKWPGVLLRTRASFHSTLHNANQFLGAYISSQNCRSGTNLQNPSYWNGWHSLLLLIYWLLVSLLQLFWELLCAMQGYVCCSSSALLAILSGGAEVHHQYTCTRFLTLAVCNGWISHLILRVEVGLCLLNCDQTYRVDCFQWEIAWSLDLEYFDVGNQSKQLLPTTTLTYLILHGIRLNLSLEYYSMAYHTLYLSLGPGGCSASVGIKAILEQWVILVVCLVLIHLKCQGILEVRHKIGLGTSRILRGRDC